MNSWPTMSPRFMPGIAPLYRCRSLPQMQVEVTRITASWRWHRARGGRPGGSTAVGGGVHPGGLRVSRPQPRPPARTGTCGSVTSGTGTSSTCGRSRHSVQLLMPPAECSQGERDRTGASGAQQPAHRPSFPHTIATPRAGGGLTRTSLAPYQRVAFMVRLSSFFEQMVAPGASVEFANGRGCPLTSVQKASWQCWKGARQEGQAGEAAHTGRRAGGRRRRRAGGGCESCPELPAAVQGRACCRQRAQRRPRGFAPQRRGIAALARA